MSEHHPSHTYESYAIYAREGTTRLLGVQDFGGVGINWERNKQLAEEPCAKQNVQVINNVNGNETKQKIFTERNVLSLAVRHTAQHAENHIIMSRHTVQYNYIYTNNNVLKFKIFDKKQNGLDIPH